jgi:2-desacetyl-2-hydroxyethyl bacteriochlorophyllide A dehydrogenase
MAMRAVVLERADLFGVVDKPEPVPGEDEALVRIRHSGICATDVAMLRGIAPLPVTPITPGHEWVGVIERAPSGSGFSSGDWVTLYPTKGCGKCPACRDARPHHCAAFSVLGVHRDGGSFAEYVAAPVDQLMKLPPELHNVAGALVEPATVGVHANLQGGMARGKRVAVIGAGTIGCMIAQVARAWGAGDVIMVDRMSARRSLCADLGFDHFVESGGGADEEAMLSFGGPVDIVFDNACSERTLEMAANVLEIGGTLVALGFPHTGQKLVVPYQTAYRRELHIAFSRNYARTDWDRTFELMAQGAIDVDRMVSGDYPLERFVEAMNDLRDDPGRHVKVIVTP